MDYSICPARERVFNDIAESSAMADIFAEIRKTDHELRNTIVSTYLELQKCKNERILDPASSHPAQSRLIRALTVHLMNQSIFDKANKKIANMYLQFAEQAEFLRKNTTVSAWAKLDDKKKKDVWDILFEIEKAGTNKKKILYSQMKKELSDSMIMIRCSEAPWDQFKRDSNAYTVYLMEILFSAGCAYSYQSEKVSVGDVLASSELVPSFPFAIQRHSWRFVPERFAIKTLDPTFLQSRYTHLSKVSELIAFFHAEGLKAGEYVNSAFIGEYGVYAGTITRDYFDLSVGSIPSVRLAIEVRIRNELCYLPPASMREAASFVFMRGQHDNVYTIAAMNIHQDLHNPVISEEKKEYVDLLLSQIHLAGSAKAGPDMWNQERIRKAEKDAFFEDEFELIPAMLLFGGVLENWAYITHNMAICEIGPKQMFDGSLVIPHWIDPAFGVRNYYENYWKSCYIICQGIMYPVEMFIKNNSADPILYFPVCVQKEIYRRLEACSSRHVSLLLLFQTISEGVYLLHFSSSRESLSTIRKRNDSWELKIHPNRVSRLAILGEYNSDSDSGVRYTDAEIREICTAVSDKLISSYPIVYQDILSRFEGVLSDYSYSNLQERLGEYMSLYIIHLEEQIHAEFPHIFAPSPKKKSPVPKKVVLDWDQVQAASDDLNTTAELLGVAYDDVDSGPAVSSMVEKFEDSVSVPVVALSDGDEAWQLFADALSPQQSAFVRAMLNGTGKTADLKRLAKQEGKLLDTYFDELNELAVDTLGDVLIDDGEIISEYRDVLSRALKK